MEANFYNDPRIREWIHQITEKIFIVCLLTDVESNAEFQKGCQIVMKLTSVLKEIPEFLADGVKELLEQQLPDARVINNFPTFGVTLDRMLRETILKDTDTQNKKAFNGLTSSTENSKKISIDSHDGYTERPMEASHIECVTDSVIPTIATISIPDIEIEQTEVNAQALTDALALEEALAQAEAQAKADALALAEALAKAEAQVKADALALAEALAQAEAKFEAASEVKRIELAEPISSMNDYFIEQEHSPTQNPTQADLLKRVLYNIFPNGTVYWNKSLMGQTFLAQVEDILICLHDPELPCNPSMFNKDGWKVLVCSNEDLMFPRRLERGIRQILRSGKISATE